MVFHGHITVESYGNKLKRSEASGWSGVLNYQNQSCLWLKKNLAKIKADNKSLPAISFYFISI
jgi:hypothetical protein